MRKKSNAINRNENVKVVTDNEFITAVGLEELSLKARKLLYIAISQVRKVDKEFLEFTITPLEFADMMKIDVSNIYDCAEKICLELRTLGIQYRLGEKRNRIYNAFSYIEYSDQSDIIFKLNSDMADFLLQLKKNFTQPLLEDFMRMRSPYSMAIWHLFQREMRSKKPGVTDTIEFDLTLDELRQVTGTQEKLKQIVHFKTKVLDKAIHEIEDKCLVKIEYENKKEEKRIIGFHFKATSFFHISIDELNPDIVIKAQRTAKNFREKEINND